MFGATTGGERRGGIGGSDFVDTPPQSPASLVFKASVASPTAALVNPLAPAYCSQQCDHGSKNAGYIVTKICDAIS